jgi:hypothetical protein
MKNHQSVQSQSWKQKIDVLKSRPSLFQNQERWDALIRIYHRYHWLFLFSLLLVFFGSSAIAIYSLGHVDPAKRKQPEPLPAVVVEPTSTTQAAVNPIPMWLVIAIAISCASGCLLVVRFLQRPIHRSRARQSLQASRADSTTRKHERQVKKLETVGGKNLSALAASPTNRKTVRKVVKNRPAATIIPPQPQLNTIYSQIPPMANMVDVPVKNPLPPLLRKP